MCSQARSGGAERELPAHEVLGSSVALGDDVVDRPLVVGDMTDGGLERLEVAGRPPHLGQVCRRPVVLSGASRPDEVDLDAGLRAGVRPLGDDFSLPPARIRPPNLDYVCCEVDTRCLDSEYARSKV